MKLATLDRLDAARRDNRPVVLLTWLTGGAQVVFDPQQGATDLAPSLESSAREVLCSDRGETVDSADGPVFVQPFNPPLRLFVVGAVHISQALAPIATVLGYEVTVIDPRRSFATDARFPGVRVVAEWPDEALQTLAPDARSAVVTLTHDPKLDDPALQVALRSSAFYSGSLGSKKTHAARLGRLRKAGFDDTEIARIRGPVGLAIGAQSPAEIAVAILAEIIQTLRQAGRDAGA